MPSYKLEYFNLRARGEIIRLIFAEAGIEYEDFRIPRDEWPTKYKENTPLGQVPVLTIDGKKMCQSNSIARYLAREFNLDGKSALQAGFADMLVDSVDEVMYKLPFKEKFLENRTLKEEVEKVLNEKIFPVFDKIEKKLKESGNNYLMGQDSFTYADLHMMNACQTICAFEETFMERYPELQKLTERVAARSNIQKYLAVRPNTL